MNAFPYSGTYGSREVRTLQVIGTVAVLTLCLLLTALARGDEPGEHHFDIAAQSLSSALNEFARQSQQQILFAPDIVARRVSSLLQGNMQPIPALKILLKDSGLAFKAMSNGVILVGDAHTLRVELAPKLVAHAEPSDQDSSRDAGSDFNSIIVQGSRRAALEREARSYVWGITAYVPDFVARWRRDRPICPLVGGLPHDEGEYVLTRLTKIATAAGAPVAPEHCKPNFYVIVASQPNELMEQWSKADPTMWDSHPTAEVHRFLKATGPIRAFYNPGEWIGRCMGLKFRDAVCMGRDPLQDGVLASVIVLVDASAAKSTNFAQLTAYIAMAGLTQIRLDARLGDASTILQLFADPGKAPPFGLSAWDTAYLKALYYTALADKPHIASLMAHEVEP
jgi:hypothetical protein